VSYGHIAYTFKPHHSLPLRTIVPQSQQFHCYCGKVPASRLLRRVCQRPSWHRSVAAYKKMHLAIRQSRRGRTT
jgi:hypothetical protein